MSVAQSDCHTDDNVHLRTMLASQASDSAYAARPMRAPHLALVLLDVCRSSVKVPIACTILAWSLLINVSLTHFSTSRAATETSFGFRMDSMSPEISFLTHRGASRTPCHSGRGSSWLPFCRQLFSRPPLTVYFSIFFAICQGDCCSGASRPCLQAEGRRLLPRRSGT